MNRIFRIGISIRLILQILFVAQTRILLRRFLDARDRVNLPSPPWKSHFLLQLQSCSCSSSKIKSEDEGENEDDYDVFHITRRPITEISPRAIAATHFG
jgi:hypothetical protein